MTEIDVRAAVLEHARQILDRNDITLDDDFFAIGGDSIVGMRFVGRVGRTVGLPIRMALLFRTPVLGEFATKVEAAHQEHVLAGERSRGQ